MSFLCSLEVEFLVKPWLCSTCQGSGLRGWIWNGTAAATIGILCQIFFRSSWGYWWWWLFYKKNDVQSPFQVWLEVLCRRAIGSHRAAPVQIMWSSLWITHVHFSNSDVPKLHWRGVRKNLFFLSSIIFTWRRCGRLRKSTSFWLLFSVTTWSILDFGWFLSNFFILVLVCDNFKWCSMAFQKPHCNFKFVRFFLT